MSNILLLEPASSNKRRGYSEIFISPNRINQPGLEEIKIKLREVRDYSVTRQDALVDELINGVASNPNVDITFAVDAGLAVKRIKEISGDCPIVINKSAVIKRELVPPLISADYPVIESYYDEFKPFENRFNEYWQLPHLLFESRWRSFERPINLSLLREKNIQIKGTKDIIGLVGVNAISAREGSVVLLQHMSNIGKIFEQARKIILVAGLDKIVRDIDEAVFQAKCMAVFGAEALPLTFNRKTYAEAGINDLSYHPLSETAKKIHVILLDNGRSRIRQTIFRDLLSCIGCQACIRDCPASRYFAENTPLSPKEYVHRFIMGEISSIERCLQCKRCEASCPLNIDLPGMILEAKRRMSKKRRPLGDYLLSNIEMVEELGSSMPWLVGPAFNSRHLRWLGEKMTGISRRRQIPVMQRETFEKWFRSREKRIEGDGEGS
jgi:L-lactate utilization protein LutB